jgi:hypothetical protein
MSARFRPGLRPRTVERMNARLIRRWHSPTLFALIGLCFLLPFATVSCDGAETTFTGAQLATWQVPEGGVVDGGELGRLVEDEASGAAAAMLAVSVLGLLLGAIGRPGGGWCAVAGLAALVRLTWSAATVFGPEVTFHEGYGLMFFLFLWIVVLHTNRAWKRRRRRKRAPGARRVVPPPAPVGPPARKSDPRWAARIVRARSTDASAGR